MTDPSDELVAAVQHAALRVVSDSDYECPGEWAIELILRVAHDAGLIVYRDEYEGPKLFRKPIGDLADDAEPTEIEVEPYDPNERR